MYQSFGFASNYPLDKHGLKDLKNVYWSLPRAKLIQESVKRGEGEFENSGGFVTITGEHTGRSANDKFTVDSGALTADIDWGKANVSISPENYQKIKARMLKHFEGKDVFVQDVFAGKHPQHQLPVRIVTLFAWHSLFARNMFVDQPNSDLATHVPEFTVLNAPDFTADPETEGTHSGTFIIVNFEEKMVLIGGTSYAGEIKKSIFTVMNYVLPKQGILGMHCSANVGEDGSSALFFGLSGTGKTTLSSDPDRLIVGDDEHGWADDGIFNFEGGSYAKLIRLNKENEPLIYNASRRYGAILENVYIDPDTHIMDYDDARYTQNTRVSYPIEFLPNSIAAYAEFGRKLGLAFQAHDDILGIWGSESETGKSNHSDLLAGKKSLPVLIGLELKGQFAELWHQWNFAAETVSQLAAALESDGAQAKSIELVNQLTQEAMSALQEASPNGEGGEALGQLTMELLKRNH